MELKAACKSSWSRPRNPESFNQDPLEFGKACEDLSWNHCTSNPHRSWTIKIAEWAVRRIKEGTSAVLLQSGLDENWLADSMTCYCYLRNIRDRLTNGKTPNERRFGELLLKDRSFRLVLRLNIIPYPRRISQESINLKRKCSLEFSPVCTVRGENLESGHTGCGLWGAGRDGRIGNPC